MMNLSWISRSTAFNPKLFQRFLFGVLLTFIVLCISFRSDEDFRESEEFHRTEVLPDMTGWKTIYFMTKYKGRVDTWEKIFRRIISGQCQESRCTFVSDRDDLGKADAVVFSGLALPPFKKLPKNMLSQRQAKQRFVYFNMNPPTYARRNLDLKDYSSFFNWTMTYRRDSDVWSPYGIVIHKNQSSSVHHLPEELTDDGSILWKVNKTQMVIAFQSTCSTPSGREAYLKQLQRYIPVTVFGECGRQTDNRRVSIVTSAFPTFVDATEKYIPKYYFYFAFENSLCPDFISEAFFRALRLGAIPIVRSSRADYHSLAPPHSYIDADQFKSPETLAKYLKEVTQNSTLYESYHKWRDDYIVRMGYPYDSLPCELCAKLHQDDRPSTVDNLLNFASMDSCLNTDGWKL